LTTQPSLRWWREVLYVLVFYGVYTLIRNKGISADAVDVARRHAGQVIRVERALGSFHEETIQDWFLGQRWFISFWNIYYGTAHFAVTIFALVWMFRRDPRRYPRWRNTLMVATALALFGYAFYPLMPPRLLPASYGFVDTLKEVGGLWSFDSGTMQKISNQYAAMPSLHFCWSTWGALVLYPMARRRWLKVLAALYPAMTLFAIVVTANHYWLDAAGGAFVLLCGYLVATALTRVRRDTPSPASLHP
jgi:hypothetical protein